MKIAFVFDEFDMGGIERTGCSYIHLLCRKGIEVDVYNLHPGKNAMAEELPGRAGFYEVCFDRVFCPELYNYGVQKWWWGKFAYPAMHAAASLLLQLRKLMAGKKEYDAAIAFSGHINDLTFVTSGLVKARQKICWCHGSLLSYLAICDAYAILYKRIDKIVTLSEKGIHEVYAGHAYLYQKKIRNIYNPVLIRERRIHKDFTAFLKSAYGDFMLMIARFTYQKDPRTVMLAVAELKRRGLSKKLVFIGGGEELEECRKFAAEKNVSDLCVFEGARKNVQDYIAASYINVLASRFEGLPTVIAEAMAFGKPCVMTDSDGGEISGYGKYCFLVRVGNDAELADCLEKLYRDADIYRKYAELARERFQYFEPESMIQKLMSFLIE